MELNLKPVAQAFETIVEYAGYSLSRLDGQRAVAKFALTILEIIGNESVGLTAKTAPLTLTLEKFCDVIAVGTGVARLDDISNSEQRERIYFPPVIDQPNCIENGLKIASFVNPAGMTCKWFSRIGFAVSGTCDILLFLKKTKICDLEIISFALGRNDLLNLLKLGTIGALKDKMVIFGAIAGSLEGIFLLYNGIKKAIEFHRINQMTFERGVWLIIYPAIKTVSAAVKIGLVIYGGAGLTIAIIVFKIGANIILLGRVWVEKYREDHKRHINQLIQVSPSPGRYTTLSSSE